MTRFELDKETYLVFPLFALGSLASLGLVSTDILPFVNLGDTIIELGNIQWTIGRVVALGSLIAVIVNRDTGLDLGGWGTVEVWTLYVTFGLLLAPPFFPALADTLAETPAAVISFLTQSIGFALITYIN